MITLSESLSFSVPHMQRLQELGVRMLKVAEDTASKEEASLERIRKSLEKLPSEVSARELERALDDVQGTLVPDLYKQARNGIYNRIEDLAVAVPEIDQECAKKMEALTEETKGMVRQLIAIGEMTGGSGISLPLNEFKRALARISYYDDESEKAKLIALMKHMGWPVDVTASIEDLERAYLAYMSPFGDGVAHGNSGVRENLIDIDYWYPTENLKKMYQHGLKMGGDIQTLVYANVTVKMAEAAYDKAQMKQLRQMNQQDFFENEAYRYEQHWVETQRRQGLSAQEHYNVLEDKLYSDRIAKGYYNGFDYSAFEGPGKNANNASAYQNYKQSLVKSDVIENSEVIITGDKFGDQKLISELTKDGSSINDWAKMESNYKYTTEYGTGKIHYYKNIQTGEVSYYDAKIKIPAPKDLKGNLLNTITDKDGFWIIDLDDNLIPKGVRE